MAEVAPAPAPAAAPAKAAKKKATKPKKTGPSVSDLIVKAVAASKERSGVSAAALKKALAAGGYDVDKNKARVKTAIKSLVTKGTLVQTKGTGASGSFKMSKTVEKKPAKKAAPKPKKAAVAKKPAAAKKPKAAAAKKPVAAKKSPKKAKKPAAAPKKAAKSPKKAAKSPKKPTKSPKKKAVVKKAPAAAKKAPAAKKTAKPKAKKAAPKKKHGVLGQLTGQQEANSRLDLPGGDGGALVVVSQAGGLRGDPLEDVVDEGVHDAHRLGGNPGVGMDLLEHLIDVDGVALLPGLSLLLSSFAGGFSDGFLGALLGRGLGGFRHYKSLQCGYRMTYFAVGRELFLCYC
ncbi:uncharacterized protein ACNS7B_011687 [Menidia menidia]